MFESHVKGVPDITGRFNTIAPDITGFLRPRYNRLPPRAGAKSRYIWGEKSRYIWDDRVLQGRLYLGRESRLIWDAPYMAPIL